MARVASSASPNSIPSRRVTRSQSREPDGPNHGHIGHGPSGSMEEEQDKGKATASRLSVVAEESPSSRLRTPNSRLGTSTVPESPGMQEGHTNISGTTFLPPDSDLEDGEPDPALMADELPDLQRAATAIMDLLLAHSSDPIGIVNEAKRLHNPQNVRYKRLKHAVSKFLNSVKVFSNHTYIDVNQVCRLIPPVSTDGAEQSWSPLPILYKANCARLALDVLPTVFGAQSPEQAIRSLEGRFPALFMSSVVGRTRPRAVGASRTDRATFERALEIRTWFFILELERRRSDKDFDPHAILKGVFCDELALDGDNSHMGPGSLRGFNLTPTYEDGNGCLPDQFQDAVTDRMSELEYDLFDEDGVPNIKGLKAAYPWSRFVLHTARWMLIRDSEIREDLQRQQDMDNLRDALDKEMQRHINEASAETPARRSGSVVPHTGERRPRESLSQEIRAAQTAHQDNAASPEMGRSLDNSTTFVEPAPPTVLQRSPVSQAKQPAPSTADQKRRKTLARGFLKNHSLDALKRREQNLSKLKSQAPSRPSAAHNSRRGLFEYPDFEDSVTAGRSEIPQSPDLANDGEDDSTLRQDDEALSFNRGRASGVVESTSPPGSSRINQASHGHWFDSPPARPPRSPSVTTEAFFRTISQDVRPVRSAFIDHQRNAQRVSPISQDTGVASAERQRAPVNLEVSRKRAREDSDGESSEEDDFDRDDRIVDVAERRTHKPEQTQQTAKRSRLSQEESDAAHQLHENLHASSGPAAPSQALVPHEPTAPAPAASPASRSSTLQRPLSKRWSEEETERLIHLIGICHTSWAEIKRKDELWPSSQGGPKLSRRDQVALKDRGRNLRRKFDREGEPLPPGFEYINP